MMASVAVGLGSAPSSVIASFDTLLSIQRYRGIVLCTALGYIWAARLCFRKWQLLRWGPVKGERLALTPRLIGRKNLPPTCFVNTFYLSACL